MRESKEKQSGAERRAERIQLNPPLVIIIVVVIILVQLTTTILNT